MTPTAATAFQITSPRIFISHASGDAWVARQIAQHIRARGAETFLDCEQIEHGDAFDEKIVEAAQQCSELLVLFTPTAVDRKYIWLEIGMFLFARKRVVAALYGVRKEEIAADQSIPTTLKSIDSVELNEIESYFLQLERRVGEWRAGNG
jgi:hypothetical protein